MPASEPFISKGTVEHTSNCEFLRKIYHFPSFWKLRLSTKLTYTSTLSAIYALTILNADVSENTLPFVSQSINNFSDYGISQSVSWECPSLSPHVLLSKCIQLWIPDKEHSIAFIVFFLFRLYRRSRITLGGGGQCHSTFLLGDPLRKENYFFDYTT